MARGRSGLGVQWKSGGFEVGRQLIVVVAVGQSSSMTI
jgi:hypothetical protein